jgi:FRG domain
MNDTIQEFSRASDLWDALSATRALFREPSVLIFRGQADADWDLLPNVLRPAEFPVLGHAQLTSDMQVYYELRLLTLFCEHCDQIGLRTPLDSIALRKRYLDNNAQDEFFMRPGIWPNSALHELMAMAQHHGVPTRLLDWTRQAHTACYFAATGALKGYTRWTREKRFAIWVLNVEPVGLLTNKVSLVRPPGSVTPHLAAQAGLFTLQHVDGVRGAPLAKADLNHALWGSAETRELLLKMTLPATEAASLFRLCERTGVNAATLYRSPDAAAIATRETLLAEDAERWLLEHRLHTS